MEIMSIACVIRNPTQIPKNGFFLDRPFKQPRFPEEILNDTFYSVGVDVKASIKVSIALN